MEAADAYHDTDRKQKSEVVQPDHRMAETGQQTFDEGRRSLAAHDEMRRCRRCGEQKRNCDKNHAAKQTKAHVIPLRLPPEDAVAVDFVGRSPGSRVIASLGLPGASRGSSGTSRNAHRLQLRGQPRLRARPSPRSLLRPAGAGTDYVPTIAAARSTASRTARPH